MSNATEPVAPLVEHFFRHEAGRLVAVLTGVFGFRHFDLVEETVQATLVTALQSWRTGGVPEKPAAWIHRVAKNRVLDALRREEIAERAGAEWARGRAAESEGIDELFMETQIEDSQLRLMFACCHPVLAPEDQLALTLKALCGFGNAEIARALLITEEAAKKRVQRAREQLVEQQIALEPPPAEELGQRLDSVHQALYLLFNEGHSATRGESPIRADLCEEAARLCYLLCSHRQCSGPATFALMALMLFHAARLNARLDHAGSVLLMEDQDRGKWDVRMIHRAKEFLDEAAAGKVVSPFHLEAGIALLHSSAPSYAETNWRGIVNLYDALMVIRPSPIYQLNRAIALAELEGPRSGIAALMDDRVAEALRHYHLYYATLGELHRRTGDLRRARQYLLLAKAKTKSGADQEILNRRLAKC